MTPSSPAEVLDELDSIKQRLTDLESPLIQRERPAPVEFDTDAKKGCFQRRHACWACVTLSVAVVCCAATALIVQGSAASNSVLPPAPQSTCEHPLRFGATYYGNTPVLAGTAHFGFAFQFWNRTSLTRADGGVVHTGDMYICYQTTGLHASGPGNCTNSFVYDEQSCRLSTSLSQCQHQVQVKDTDLAIQWIDFDGSSDTVQMDTTTRLPGWVGKTSYSRTTPNAIACPKASN